MKERTCSASASARISDESDSTESSLAPAEGLSQPSILRRQQRCRARLYDFAQNPFPDLLLVRSAELSKPLEHDRVARLRDGSRIASDERGRKRVGHARPHLGPADVAGPRRDPPG